ncbi:unnamed protein product, partial [Tetraodon nigroviridis]
MMVFVDLLLMLISLARSILSAVVQTLLRPRLKSIDGELCLITGAGGALGRLFALEFAKEGARLVLWDRDGAANERTAQLARELGAQVHPYTVDVSERRSIYRTAARVRAEAGEVSILVNNAGVVAGRRLLDCPDELLERTLLVNCHALFWMTKAFLPCMKAKNHGHIVTVASALGLFSTACVEVGRTNLTCSDSRQAAAVIQPPLALPPPGLLRQQIWSRRLPGVADARAAGGGPATASKPPWSAPTSWTTGMFAGCEIRKELRSLIPPLEPLYTVQQAMKAILAEQQMICIPRLMYIPFLTRALLPWEANVAAYRFLGGDKCMLPFIENAERKSSG